MPIENTKKNKAARQAKHRIREATRQPYYQRLGYSTKTQYRNHRKAIKALHEPVIVQNEDDFSDLTEA